MHDDFDAPRPTRNGTDPATLLFLSDCHMYGDGTTLLKGINTLHSLQAVVADAQARFPHPDAVVLGGDLAQDEEASSYRRLRKEMDGWIGYLRAIPGNHDEPAHVARTFGDVHMPIEVAGWRIVLLNTHHEGEVAGRLPDEELRRLESLLQRAGTQPVVLVMHHHPFPIGSRWMDNIALQNADALWKLIERFGNVKLILFGHVHQAFEGEHKGVRLFGTPSTCIQFRPGIDDCELDATSPGYRWLSLHPDGAFETGVNRVEGFIPPDLSDNSEY